MHAHSVATLQGIRRQFKISRQAAIVRQQQQAFAGQVEPADADHARQPGRQMRKDGRTPFLVARGEVGVTGLLGALGDAVQRPVQRPGFPVVGEGGAVEDVGDAVGVDGELEGVGPLGAESALVDGAFGIALDVDELASLGVDELSATDGAVGAHGRHDGLSRPGLRAGED